MKTSKAIETFASYLQPFLQPQSIQERLPPSDVVGCAVLCCMSNAITAKKIVAATRLLRRLMQVLADITTTTDADEGSTSSAMHVGHEG